MTAAGSPNPSLDPEHLRELVSRYDRPGPRYTSYPTAPVWSEDFGPEAFREGLRRVASREVAVYVHVPFCERLCSFCACNRKITQDHSVAGPYLDGVEREAETIAGEIGGIPRAVQVALGGGSPNFLSPRELERLAGIVDRCFPRGEGAERSIELDPRNTTREQIETLVALGFNRVSLGVQDTSPRVQTAINRVQPPEQVEALTSTVRELGVGSVSFDLIYGLPYQTVESFERTLDEVIEIRPDRIALYSYAHVTWISKAQRGFEKKDLPVAEVKLAIFLRAVERLTDAGYRYLGLDHFAVPEDELARACERGELRRNFMGSTLQPGLDLIALGPSGISELSDSYAQSERDPDAWRTRVLETGLATLRGWRLTEDDVRRRWLIHRAMCQGEISAGAYAERFGEALADRIPGLESTLAPLTDDGLLEWKGQVWRVTPIGRIFLRVIAMTFDAYLSAPEPDRPRFSRTV